MMHRRFTYILNIYIPIHPHKCHWLRRFIFPWRRAAHDCIARRPPKHGAMACDDWMFGSFCSPYCNDQYDFAMDLISSFWVCGANGVWRPPGNWPDCAGINYETRLHNVHHYSVPNNVLKYCPKFWHLGVNASGLKLTGSPRHGNPVQDFQFSIHELHLSFQFPNPLLRYKWLYSALLKVFVTLRAIARYP